VQPNPFSNTTNILFTIPQDETVSIAIYDMLGRQIKFMQAHYAAGEYKIAWAGDDAQGNLLSRGLYHIRMETEHESRATKAVLMK